MVGYNSFAVFLFSAIALVIASGFSLGAVLLIVGSAALLWKRPKLALKRDDYLLIGVLALYFTVHSANNYYHGAPGREYDAPLRFLLAIPALLLLLAYPAKPAAIWSGLAVGAIGAGIFSGWQFLVEGQARTGGTTNPIQYGNISILLGILCLCGLAWSLKQLRKTFWTALLVAGTVFGLLGSLFTGSRGSWIALPFCIVILAIHHANSEGKRYLQAGLLALVMLIGVAYALPQSSIRQRTELAVQEAQEYIASGNAGSSVGARLEMWRSGIAMVPEHPWTGWGKQGYMNQKMSLIGEGKIAAAIGEHTHMHNEYLDALVKHGILGLAVLLALYLVPLRLFARKFKNCADNVHPYAIAGVLLTVSYILFGLTQAFLTHNNGVMMFSFLLIILWSALRSEQRSALA